MGDQHEDIAQKQKLKKEIGDERGDCWSSSKPLAGGIHFLVVIKRFSHQAHMVLIAKGETFGSSAYPSQQHTLGEKADEAWLG